jgi:putative tricarboxylic transport membrane protein
MEVEKKRDISEGVFWLGIGVVICLLALRFDLGSFHAPGAGFVAFLAGAFIGLMGVIMIASKLFAGVREKERAEASAVPSSTEHGRLIYTMVVLVLYAVLMDPLGFILSTALVMFGLFFDWQKRNWFWSGFFAIATSLSSYFVFEVWLRCQLPRGILPWW